MEVLGNKALAVATPAVIRAGGPLTHANDSFTRGWAGLGPTATPTATAVETSPAYVGRYLPAVDELAVVLGDSATRVRICSYDWSCEWAIAVVFCESTNNPNAYSSAGHVGLFQIDATLHGYTVGELTDAGANIAAAFSIYQSEGPGAWPRCP